MVSEGKIRSLQTENEALRLHLKLALESLKNPIPEVVVNEKQAEAGKENADPNDEEEADDKNDDDSLIDEAYYDDEDDGYSSEYQEDKANDMQDYMQELLQDLSLFRRKIGDDKGRFMDENSRNPLGVRTNL